MWGGLGWGRMGGGMPELPEVETTCRGIAPHVVGVRIGGVVVRRGDLREEVSGSMSDLTGARVVAVRRRAKYLLLELDGRHGHLLVHLGMSGSLRVVRSGAEMREHDHIVVELAGGKELRYHDPRRFGIWLRVPWGEDPLGHRLLRMAA